MPLSKLGGVTAVAWNDSWDGEITKHNAHRPGAEAGPEPEAKQQNQQKLLEDLRTFSTTFKTR